jgi:hypothetical protein
MSIINVKKKLDELVLSINTNSNNEILKFISLINKSNNGNIITRQEYIGDDNQFGPIRLVMTANDYHINNNYSGYKIYNGIVIEISINSNCELCYKFLVIPDRIKKINAQIGRIPLDKYKIYPLVDGTCISLYWYDEWTISSRNGYDVKNIYWRDNKSFWECFVESLNEYAEFSFDKLDKNVCYNLIFVNKHYHPFNKKNKVFLLSAYDVTKIKNVYPQIGVDSFKEIKDINIRQLNNSCFNAFNDYTCGDEVCFGYVLRNINPKFNDIIIESSLMRSIRKLIYQQNNPIDFVEDGNLYFKEFDYVAMRAYMTSILSFRTFVKLFPEYSFKSIDDFFDSLADNIVKCIYDKKKFPFQFSLLMDHYFGSYMNSSEKIKESPEFIKSTVIDILKDPKLLNKCYKMWKKIL